MLYYYSPSAYRILLFSTMVLHRTCVVSARAATTNAAFQVEAAVIGAGVIGLAIARSLAVTLGKEVIILDRAGAIGTETSSRNSEVIHAGLYYPSNSLKAKFCVEGKHMLYEYCQSRNIAHQNCGKLIVATQQEHHPIQQEIKEENQKKLVSLQQRAIQNGVHDTQIISAQQVQELEPEVQCLGALWSPSTGVVDSHSFMLSLLADAEDHGATLALHSGIVSDHDENSNRPPGDNIDNNFSANSGDGIYLPLDDDAFLQCKIVVNSAGLWAHHVAKAIHKQLQYNSSRCSPQKSKFSSSSSSSSWKIPTQYFAKGNYFRLQGCKNPFRHLVYPLPEPGGLGVHATLDWTGTSLKFGPDVEWIDPTVVTSADDIDLRPNPQRADGFYDQIRKYWPNLPDDSLVPDYAGIRPKLHHPSLATSPEQQQLSSSFFDFTISTPKEHGIPGLIHLFGMESPGLTSSMAIGEFIAQEVQSWD
jgi:L-2-hydroxyglutarate oxidase LhgO